MYKSVVLTGIVLLVLPAGAFAACSTNGATVVYINGIETTQQQADSDTNLLRRVFAQDGGSQDVQIITAYNPTHLDGIGDELESISQAFNSPISNFDLTTILMQVAPEITTQKLLLLGYSQGSFYANEMYEYLITHGTEPTSVGVYNIATPANMVAGNGTYLTSGDDKLINQVRVWDAEAGLPQPLPANILIHPQWDDNAGLFGGHRFGGDYLAGAASRVVSDIEASLSKLSDTGSTTCFAAPTTDLLYDIQKALFSAADPVVANVDGATKDTAITIASINKNANDIVRTAFSDAIFSVFPKPDANSAGAVFSVEKALYGSSLSESDYEALLNGQNPEEVVTAPTVLSPQRSSDQVISPEPTDQPVVPQEVVGPTSSSSEASQLSTTTITSIPPPVVVSPGFGGGGEPVSVSQPDLSAVLVQSDATSSQDMIPSGQATSTPPIQPTASSTGTDEPSTTTVAIASTTSPLTDSFDEGFSGWSNYASGWSTSAWSTSTSDCYSGSCLSEIAFNQPYENIKKGTSLIAGSFVLYFRNDGYPGVFGEGVCTDDVPDECEDFSRIGGADALLAPHFNAFHDNTWHYLYFAFRDGAVDKEYCDMVDDNDATDCQWQTSSVANGTTYSDVLFFTSNGLNPNTSFYWDELGLAPHPPTGP